MSKLLFLLSFFSFMSCSMLDSRDFYDEMAFEGDGAMFRPNNDFMVLSGDSGRDYRSDKQIQARTPYSERSSLVSMEDERLRREARYLESKLNETEYVKYSKAHEEFKTDSEKIYYLRLSARDRVQYLASRRAKIHNVGRDYVSPTFNPVGTSRGNSRMPASLVQQQVAAGVKEIALGMSMEDVSTILGTPERRDIAGDSMQKNERWAYRDGAEIKYIYFAGGLVEGWNHESEYQ